MTKRGLLISLTGFFVILAPFSLLTVEPAHTISNKPKELKLYQAASESSGSSRFCIKPWIKNIQEATQNRIKIRIYGMASLGSPRESYELVKSGGAHMGGIVMGFFPGRFQLTNVIALPFIGFQNAEIASSVYWDLFEKFPQMRDQFQGVRVDLLHTDCSTVIGTRKPIRTLEDIKGMKIRALSGMPIEMLKAWGASPMLLPPGEIYTAMERGTIDGWMISWEGVSGFRLYEITDHFTLAPFYNAQMAQIMNLKVWNSLPEDIQKVFQKYGGAAGSRAYGKGFDEAGNETIELVKKMKNKDLYILPPDEVKRWRKASRPVWDTWIAEMDKLGLPGDEVLNETLNLIKKYSK